MQSFDFLFEKGYMNELFQQKVFNLVLKKILLTLILTLIFFKQTLIKNNCMSTQDFLQIMLKFFMYVKLFV